MRRRPRNRRRSSCKRWPSWPTRMTAKTNSSCCRSISVVVVLLLLLLLLRLVVMLAVVVMLMVALRARKNRLAS